MLRVNPLGNGLVGAPDPLRRSELGLRLLRYLLHNFLYTSCLELAYVKASQVPSLLEAKLIYRMRSNLVLNILACYDAILKLESSTSAG